MNYFVVRVPLSYLNAVEAQNYYKIKPEESILVVLRQERYPIDLEVIKKIIDASLWREIHYVSYNLSAFRIRKNRNKPNIIFDYFHKIIDIKYFVGELDTIKQENTRASMVFIGNENTVSMRHIVNSIKPVRTIVLDEGFAVVNNVAEKIKAMKMKSRRSSVSHYIKVFLAARVFGYKIQALENVSYFSSYELSRDILHVKNTYEKLRSELSKQISVKQVLFLGQSLVENLYMAEEVYIECIRQIRDHYHSMDFVYCPHRDEHPNKLERLKLELGLVVQYSQLPIEYRLTKEKYLPEVIASFYSSALQNSHHIFKGIVKIESFMLQSSHFVTEYEKILNGIQNCYNYLTTLESESFHVIKLPTISKRL